MAAKPKRMHQIKNILRLHLEGKSIRFISIHTGIARNTVREYIRRGNRCKVPLEQLLAMEDEALSAFVYREPVPAKPDERMLDLTTRLPTLTEQLRQRGVTRWLLWTEYIESYPQGYSYSQFCEHLSRYLQVKGSTMYFHHKPAEQMMIDFAGDKLRYVDAETGEIIPCPVVVTVFPYSGWTYVEPFHSQKQEEFIPGVANALIHAGGVPQSIKLDNMRAAVTKANRYEPSFTEAMEHFAAHYGITVMAARVRKPRDKAAVENAVGIVYKRVFAPLRNQVFHSLQELKLAVQKQLQWHNEQLFQGKDHSRKSLFEKEEQPLLKPLPPTPFEIRHIAFAKVQKNYHVILGEDRHQYSVPYTLIGKKLKLVYSAQTVEIYDDYKRVAFHQRSYRKHGYTTLAEHMPSNHRHEAARRGWNADYFKEQALQIGKATHAVVERILSSRNFHEQSYTSCLGILRLAKHYDNKRLEAACGRALQSPSVNFRMIHNILKNGLDKQEPFFEDLPPLIQHENVRGAEAYQ